MSKMEAAKDTCKQEKQPRAIRIGGGGGVAVWGGVAVVGALVVASYSAIKNSRKRRSNGRTTACVDKLNKGNREAETKNEAGIIEIMGKSREDKADGDNNAIAGEEKNDEDPTINSTTQKDRLSTGKEANVRIIEGVKTIKAMPRNLRVEADYKEQVNREQGHVRRESVVKKDEELAGEIEVGTPVTLSGESGEDSDENSIINEDGGDNAQKGSQIQHMGKEEEKFVRNDTVERKVQLNQFATRGKLEVTEEKSIHEEEGREYGDGKGMMEKEESSNTNEEDDEDEDEDEGEGSSKGTGDSSMESNIERIWPAEAIDDVLMEIKQRKIDTQISEEKTDCIKVEMEEKGIKNDYNAANLYEVEYSGKTKFSSLKRYIKEFPFYSSNARVWLWAMLVLTLALAAPLVLSAGEIMKLAHVVFFVVGLSRAVDTII